MGRIHVLDPHVVNQIAAGEVVERPASAVKELVENALDAGAGRIDIEVAQGGRTLIQVSDDGWGMGPDDLQRVFLPHATSKISSAEDLQHITSLGFRGEALASLGAVARVRVVSRLPDMEGGFEIVCEEGHIAPVTPCSAAPGTVVAVEGLFRHVPARRRFLRSPVTELGHVSEWIERFCLAHPAVGFRLQQGARLILDAPRGEGRPERIARWVGAGTASALVPAVAERDGLHLSGWVGPPGVYRRDSRFEHLFVNGRWIRDRTASHALREAYRDLLPPGGSRPIAFLFLTTDPSRVDVNVHPTKAEVRWHDGQAVHALIRSGVREALEKVAPGGATADGHLRRLAVGVEARLRQGAGESLWAPEWPSRRGSPPAGSDPWGRAPGDAGADADAAHSAHVAECAAGVPAPPLSALRYVGQVLETYLVLEAPDALVLIDQHALHERVLFDQINARLRESGRLEVQRLLVPTILHLEASQTARVLEAADLLLSLGWEIEAFGRDALAIRGMPSVAARLDPEAVLSDLARHLEDAEGEGVDRAALLDAFVDRMACRAAIMAGDRVGPEEAAALLQSADSLPHQHSCPHGRPTRIVVGRRELERWFHRRV